MINISVIVTTFNHEKYIKKCIDSILMQDNLCELEIIIGDDASTDNTANIILDYYNKYPNLIVPVINKSNIGASRNFMNLLLMAKGKYIATLEGDDFWLDKFKLRLQKKYMEQDMNLIGIVHNVLLVDKNNNILPIQKISWVKNVSYITIDNYDGMRLPGHISSLFFRNIILNYKNIDFSLIYTDKNVSDKMIFIVLLSLGNMLSIDRVMSAYRVIRGNNEDNMVSKQNASTKSSCYKNMEMLNKAEKWLMAERGINKKYRLLKNEILITAIFHKIIGFNVSIKTIIELGNFSFRDFIYFPISFFSKVIEKILFLTRYHIR